MITLEYYAHFWVFQLKMDHIFQETILHSSKIFFIIKKRSLINSKKKKKKKKNLVLSIKSIILFFNPITFIIFINFLSFFMIKFIRLFFYFFFFFLKKKKKKNLILHKGIKRNKIPIQIRCKNLGFLIHLAPCSLLSKLFLHMATVSLLSFIGLTFFKE